MSSRPKPKPKVGRPIDSIAQFPAKTSRSAQESLRPYFCLIGQSRRRALSRLTLPGQLLRGAKPRWPRPPPPRPSPGRELPPRRPATGPGPSPVGPGRVPCHPNEQLSVVPEVRGLPLLRVGHERGEILL